MKAETQDPRVYRAAEHSELPVSQESLDRFVSLLPYDAREAFALDTTVAELGDVVDVVHDHMLDFMRTCQTRPALPHEREDRGNVRFLTAKGVVKYDAHLGEVATAFADAFGLSPMRPGKKYPTEGPLDPLTYD